MKIKCMFTGIILLFLVSCATVDFAPSSMNYMNNEIFSTTDVEIYRTQKPNRKFKEIGTVHVYGSAKLETCVDKMKEEAARQGGNAIIDIKITSNGAVGTVVSVEK